MSLGSPATLTMDPFGGLIKAVRVNKTGGLRASRMVLFSGTLAFPSLARGLSRRRKPG